MADPNIAIAAVLEHEGGFVDDPADPGGATNFGITQADLPGQDVRTLTAAQAAAWYLANRWTPAFDAIADQALATKVFDLGVLAGMGTAARILQDVLGIAADGILGPRTVAAVNGAAAMGLRERFQAAMAAHFTGVAEMHPAERKFLQGWINRVNS